MTNGRSTGGMASFLTKKKKYKFQVDVSLEELLEVPFVSAVLFAKLRLLDGGDFQDQSSREEVVDHKVQWGAKFSFKCKMTANATTGIMDRCLLRISVRKESKGGRSFTKLGYVDVNLAEYAGAGVSKKKALLEGYDTRHRQDNSMLMMSIQMNMLEGDIVFKAPSPTVKHSQVTNEQLPVESNRPEEFSGGSVAGSVASGSSGFGSLPKKRPALLTSELVIGQSLSENNGPSATTPVIVANDPLESNQLSLPVGSEECPVVEPGHSRNSSNTSQLSKASGYSSIHSHSHSRQSSSGDSGHIRDQLTQLKVSKPNAQKLNRAYTYPKRLHIPSTIYASPLPTPPPSNDNSLYQTPTNHGNSSTEEYMTPDESFKNDFSPIAHELKKSQSASFVERLHGKLLRQLDIDDLLGKRVSNPVEESTRVKNAITPDVLRSKSEFQIPRIVEPRTPNSSEKSFKFFKSDSLFSFLTPRPIRKQSNGGVRQSTPNNRISPTFSLQSPSSPIPKLHSLPETRTASLSSLETMATAPSFGLLGQVAGVRRSLPHHRKFMEGAAKLAPVATSPEEPSTNDVATTTAAPSAAVTVPANSDTAQRRTSITTNPSSSSLALSETGSLDRARAAYERRKKTQSVEGTSESGSGGTVAARVETTRVNPDDLIEELLKNTNFEPADYSAESSGLQLFIAKDGTAALGNHEVKSQMSTGVQAFKQVVMDDR